MLGDYSLITQMELRTSCQIWRQANAWSLGMLSYFLQSYKCRFRAQNRIRKVYWYTKNGNNCGRTLLSRTSLPAGGQSSDCKSLESLEPNILPNSQSLLSPVAPTLGYPLLKVISNEPHNSLPFGLHAAAVFSGWILVGTENQQS